MKKPIDVRIALLLISFLIAYILIIFRLFYWQVIRSDELKDIGRLQSSESLVVEAARGEIFFNDQFPLATNNISYLLYANPKLAENINTYASLLSPILEIDEASISASLSQDLYWVKIIQSIDSETKKEIEKLNLAGVGFQQEALRYYPEASMAAHLVGFVGKDEKGSGRGYFGLEGFYNGQLQGKNGRLYVVKDALGNPILTDIRREAKIDGRDLVLSLDRAVQFFAQNQLKNGIERYNASGGSVIIMEPDTGKIIAASSLPKFDPQKYFEYDPELYKSPIVSNLYEPGSTFKVLTMAAAIDDGAVEPDTKCPICDGPIIIGEYKIKTWNDKYFPNTTMAEVIENSDNTGMVYMSQKLGIKKMVEYLEKFGIGEITGIDVQGETAGEIREDKLWSNIDLATASFGQGISVTPIQLITAVSAIANGGELIQPTIVSKIITEDKKEIIIEPNVRRRVVSKKTAKLITWMMVNAVEKGESQWTKIENYQIAGKTGTAQIPVAGHYDPDKTIASFIGFFPAENPKISMLVLVDRPTTSIYGSETAAPIFFSIARDLIQYYGIEPSN